MVKKNIFNAIALIAGTTIGAGFLGMPYVVAKSGFLIGLAHLILIGLFILFVQLCLGEVILRTKGNHHLVGYAEKYLGKKGKGIMLIVTVFYIFSALVAYLIAVGQSLSFVFFETLEFSIYFTIGFWILATSLSYIGLRALKYFGKAGVIFIVGLVMIIFVSFFNTINIENLKYINFSYSLYPFGIVLFSYLSFSSMPAVQRLLLGREEWMKRAIYFGILIPAIVYFVFLITMIGNFGTGVPEVATISLGRSFAFLGVVAIFTSFLALSISLRDMFRFDLKFKRINSWLICAICPLIIFLIIYFFRLITFVQILSIAGVVSGGVTGIMILLMNLNSKKIGKRDSEYSMKINYYLIGLLSLLFILAICFEIFMRMA